MVYPVAHPEVTLGYHVFGKLWQIGYHTGIDYHADIGTPIFATRGGTVIHAGTGGWGLSYGKHVVLRVRTPWGRTREVLYAHMSHIAVNVGQKVKAGDHLGLSGDTGNVTGPHLHYEERMSPFTYGSDRKPVLPQWQPLIKPLVKVSAVQPGKHNRYVKRVQRHLNRRLNSTHVPVTGFFGELTRHKYRQWQEHLGYKGADADGRPGKSSLKKLGFRVR